MKKQLTVIAEAVAPLLQSADAWQKLEAARVIAALHGILVPDAPRLTDASAIAASRHTREVIMGRIWKTTEVRRKINRRAFLKRRIKQLTESGDNPELLACFQKELSELLAIRKRVPASESKMPRNRSELTAGAFEALGAGVTIRDEDREFIRQAAEEAKSLLATLGGSDDNE